MPLENENYVVIENAKIIAMNLPDYDSIAEKVRTGPTLSFLDRLFRERLPKPLKPLPLAERCNDATSAQMLDGGSPARAVKLKAHRCTA